MALFSRKKKEEGAAPVAAAPVVKVSTSDVSHVLMNQRITEKATMLTSGSIYAFDIAEGANKKQVAQAFAKIYKVTPQKVRIVKTPAKNVRNMRTGKRGVKSGGKKAYVYLAKGETITIA